MCHPKGVWKRGAKRETEDHMWCQHLVTNPGPNHTHTPFTSLFSPQVLLSPCCGSHSFAAAPFWLDDKRRMVCVMSNKHTKVALLFLCQPSLQPPLSSCHSPHSCPCGVVVSVDVLSMQPMRRSEVSAIITPLWCLVFVVWCPQSPLLFPISLHHPLVVLCVWLLHDCMVLCCLMEWCECMDSHTKRNSTQACLCVTCCVLCWYGVECGV